MSEILSECMEKGIQAVESSYGEFDERPKEYKLEDLLDGGEFAKTESHIPVRKEEHEGSDIQIRSDNAVPQEIVLDERMVDEAPRGACNSLLHELLEWRAAEEMNSAKVIDSDTHDVAAFNENHICREVNSMGEDVCMEEWNLKYDT